MKIVTWNCNGAFRTKYEHITKFNADIYVIQECENPTECRSPAYQEWAGNHIWIGDSKHKGLGVFARPEIELVKLDWTNQYQDHYVKHFLPCRVNQKFNLLAVWTHQNNSPTFGYIGQLWKYLQVNKDKLNTAIIAGDLNSNARWDQWDRWWNHSDVIRELKELGIKSLYHEYFGEQQGAETKPTLYFQRNLEKPYHIDYIFGSIKYVNSATLVEVGEPHNWLSISDHMPISCEITETQIT